MKVTWLHKKYYLSMLVDGIELPNYIYDNGKDYEVYFNNNLISVSHYLKEAKEMLLIAGGYIYEL